MIPVPDLLRLEPCLDVDYQQLDERLGLAFTGRADAEGIEQALVGRGEDLAWNAEQFADDLFVRVLVRDHLSVRAEGHSYSPNAAFLYRVLSQPPTDLETTQFRQAILRELWDDRQLYQRTLDHYVRLYELVNMFKIPGQMARLDINTFRLDLFRQVRRSIDDMASEFVDARSGLRRLHETAKEIQQTEDYEILSALLDHADHRVALDVSLKVGATGKISHLQINRVRPNEENPFHRSSGRRWFDKLRTGLWHGLRLDDDTVFNRLVQEIYERLATSIMGLAQLLGHLEIYLGQHQLRLRVEERGLSACLAELADQGPLHLDDLYNPLLLGHARDPVPCSIRQPDARSVTLLTGPNSGGKTRLLQALGLAQLLGQGGFYVMASRARLVRVHGLFVSLIEHEAVDHSEGRLGRELERIRSMFDSMRSPSMVILDELCSGTNPSEGTEVFSLVLRLLEKVRPVGFVTTHFLDYARELKADPPIRDLRFLQVEVGPDERSSYQFVPGVAETSLAALMAERMGVTFDTISANLEARDDLDLRSAPREAAPSPREAAPSPRVPTPI